VPDPPETAVTRVLLTGMSGSGKSTLVAALVERGHLAVDLDDPAWSEYRVLGEDEVPPGVEPGRDWVWREDRVAALLRTTDARPLFLAGCAPNQGRFRDEFDRVVLLTAPVDVTLTRLAARTTNPFGKSADERAKVLADKASFEPMLRAGADLVIETTEPIDTTVQRLLDPITP
jgi:dephospho-CoA kinase